MHQRILAPRLALFVILWTPKIHAQAVSPALIDAKAIATLTREQRDARFREAACTKDQLAEINALLLAGADPLDRLQQAAPPLLLAIKANFPSYAEAMLDARPNICTQPWPDSYVHVTVGTVALYYALEHRQHALARRLLTREKVKPTAWRPINDDRLPSALGHAVKNWDVETVRLLVEAGASYAPLPAGEGFFTLFEDYGFFRPSDADRERERKREESHAIQQAASLERLRQKVNTAATPEAKTRAEASLNRMEKMQRAQRERDLEWKSTNNRLNQIRQLASFRAPNSPNEATGINDWRIDRASPLSIAVANDWSEVVALLVQAGADPSIGLIEQRSILDYAADKPAMLRALTGKAPAEDSASLSEPSAIDGPALIAALAKNDEALLRDAPISSDLLTYSDPKLWTLLHHAINLKNDEFALRLIEAGANIEAATEGGQTPLTFAGFKARAAVTRALLAKKAALTAPAETFVPPLAGACVGGDVEIVRMLLDAGADPRATYNGGVPIVLCAAHYASPEVISLMVEHGASLDVTDRKGTGPLEITFLKDNSAALGWMLDHGARWHSATRSDESGPLLNAVRRRAWNCAHLLLERGEIDERALPLAADPRFKAALEDKLQASGSTALDDEELWPSICTDRENGRARADAHLAKGGDINYAGSNWTPLIKAIYAGDIDLVRHLIAKGADPRKHPRQQLYADMLTLAHLYQGSFGKTEHQTIDEFLAYRAELIRLLAPLEPSEEYSYFLTIAARTKRWEEIEAYLAVGTPATQALKAMERMPDLKDEERTRLRNLLSTPGSK